MAKKLKIEDFQFVDLTENDLITTLSGREKEDYIKDTVEAIKITKKFKYLPKAIGLCGGIVALRGGELSRVNLFGAKYNGKPKGLKKDEKKAIKKVIRKFRLLLAFKIVLTLIAEVQFENNNKLYYPTVAKRK